MHLIKNGNKYYTVKNNNSNYGIYGDYYTIINGRLLWANPNIYLQSTGTQYINTGITADSNTSLILNYQIDNVRDISSNTRNHICGGSAGYTTMKNFYATFWCSTETNTYYWLNTSNLGSGNTVGQFVDYTAKYRIELNGTNIDTKSYLYKNDVLLHTRNNVAGEITQTLPISIFARTANNTATNTFFIGKIYNSIINKNNIKMQHLVPVPKGLLIGDFIVPSNGMFDIVEQKFYENQGTGEFEIGGIPEDYINVGDNIVWVNENVYLESSGSKYIDTEVKPTNLTVVEGKTMLTTINKFIYGSRTSKTASNIHDWVVNTATANFPQFGSDDSSVTFSWSLNQIYKIKNGQDGAYVDGTLIKSYATYTFASTLNMYLFGLNQNGSLESRSLIGRIYNFQIKENSKLIRYFLPVNTNTVIGNFTVPAPGMWDAVNKKFYPNKGSGTFIYGKDN